MKKYLVAALLLTSIPSANADGYAIVDANGNQVGGVIVCDAAVCGDPNSLYSRLTLKPGERYVLQSKKDSSGNVSGINPSENTKVSVDVATTTWTVETKHKVEVTPEVAVEVKTTRTFNPTTEPITQPEPIATPTSTPTPTPTPTPSPSSAPSETSTATAENITKTETATVTSEPSPATSPEPVSEQTPLSDPEPFSTEWWAWLVAILKELFGIDL